MKPRVYIETSVISYLTARPNRDLIVSAHQQITAELWERRADFEFYASELVALEAGRGDALAAQLRGRRPGHGLPDHLELCAYCQFADAAQN